MNNEEPREKQCNQCLAFKPVDEFCIKKSNRDGLQGTCKKCNAARDKVYRAANKDKIREYRKAYYNANKEKASARDKAYRAANKDRIRERDKAYRAANKDKASEYQKAYYNANKEKINKYEASLRAAKRADRNQCAVINALNPQRMESLQSKLESLSKTKTTK